MPGTATAGWTTLSEQERWLVIGCIQKSVWSQDDPAQDLTGKGVWKDGRWKAVLTRPLVPKQPARDVTFDLGRLIPFAVQACDGANGERGLMMARSSWIYVVLEAPVPRRAYLSSLLAVCVTGLAQWWLVRRVRRPQECKGKGRAGMATREEKFRQAARCYLGYGLVYWLGGAYLAAHGIGAGRGLGWLAVGAVFVVLFPWLIARGARGAGYLWFTRLLALAVAWRAVMVGRVVVAPQFPSVPLPGGGALPMRVAAAVFLVITVATAVMLARAAWSRRAPVLSSTRDHD